MRCSGFKSRPGHCDLCGGSTNGDDRTIEDMVTRQFGIACAECARTKCWSFGPCCRRFG